jgi:hypothetical protein
MASNLALFQFTYLSNTAISDDGWYVETGIAVDALAGKDTISGSKNGIINFGKLDTGAGNDKITGNSRVDGINNHGTINTGEGDDIVTGTSMGTFSDGIWNFGMILTGAGNDRITGIGSRRNNTGESYGIDNYGVIFTGTGDDTITGKSSSEYGGGIMNERTIDTGDGNDRITGTILGRGFRWAHGIENFGIIDTGLGDDIITGTGIFNSDTITAGAGNDIIDALKGGFKSLGTTDLGLGRDTLKGFGTGTFNGGAGIDKILFGQGTYTVTGSTIVSDDVTMNVNEFEKIGGAKGGLFNYANGTLTVTRDGVATFAA